LLLTSVKLTLNIGGMCLSSKGERHNNQNQTADRPEQSILMLNNVIVSYCWLIAFP